jgi:hypothetical protein
MRTRKASVVAWVVLAITILGWALAMWMRAARPIVEPVMDASEQAIDGGFNVVLLAFVVIGAFVASRRPRNPIGWLLWAMGGLKIIGFLALEYAIRSLFVTELPGGDVAAWLWNFAYVPLFLALPCILLLFPDGHLPSNRWRWLVGLLAVNGLVLTVTAGVANWQQRGASLLTGEFETPPMLGAALIVTAFVLVASGVSLVIRYVRSTDERRAQLKWLAFSAELIALWIVSELIRQTARLEEALAVFVVDALGIIALISFPVAVGIAVLRYRLYDIDRIISRTLAYSLIVLTLVFAYAGVVLSTQAILPVDDDSPLVVAVSTLAVVALFRPLQTRVRELVDRRFYRRSYDARLTLDSFSARLRSEIDLGDLEADLLAVVADTVGPSHSSLWLSNSESGR